MQRHRLTLWAGVLLLAACGVTGGGEQSLPVDDASDVQLSLNQAELIAIPDSDVTLAVWQSQNAFALKRGNQGFGSAKKTSYELLFADSSHDPAAQRVTGEASLYLVQFYGVALPEMRDALTKFGGESVAPFPLHAYVMRLSAQALEVARSSRFVRAVEPFAASHRFSLARDVRAGEPRHYLIRPSSDRPEVRGALVTELTSLGASVVLSTAGNYLVHASMTPEQVAQAAELGEVLHIDAWSAPESDMDKVRIISGADFLESTIGFTGTGVRGEVMDGNVDDTHPDLKNRGILFHGPRSSDDPFHGTATTGIVFGDGTANRKGRGLLPTGQPIFASYNNLVHDADAGTYDRHSHVAELNQAPYQAVFQSNSWGSGLTQEYTNISAEMDNTIFDLDFLIFNSMSNSGTRDARPEAWAKNVVSIGGVKHFDTLDTADDKWAGGGTIGPAKDGRLKPELSHFWDMTFAPTPGGGYTEFGGTSGATPITAGYAGLFLQMWSAGMFGNPTPGATVFENRPHFTTSKAVLMNTATQWAFSGATHDLTRVHQGFGRVDVKRLYELRNSMLIINETDLLTQGQVKRYEVTVAASTPEFRATLTWAEPAAVPSAGLQRINDLTLKVTAPNGTVYFGNNGLDAAMFSTSGGVANTKDTAESVYVNAPAAGTWVVEVRGDEIVQDNHRETTAVDADFALVVSGIVRDTTGTPTVTFTAPANNSTVSGTVKLTASTTGSVAKVRFGLPNGTSVDDATAPYEASFDSTLLANGAAQVTAVAQTASGTSSPLATLDLTVKNTTTNAAPTVTLVVPTGSVRGTVSLTATAADSDGTVAKVRFTLPGGATVDDTTAPYSVSFDTSTVAAGTYTVKAVATDNLGLDSAASTQTLTVAASTSCANGTVAATGLPLAIADAPGAGLSVPFVVSGDGKVTTVSISLNIKHTYRGDLLVQLVSPTGVAKDISRRAGGSADDLIISKKAIAGFAGAAAAGTWKLTVADLAKADVGTLNSASIQVQTDCTP